MKERNKTVSRKFKNASRDFYNGHTHVQRSAKGLPGDYGIFQKGANQRDDGRTSFEYDLVIDEETLSHKTPEERIRTVDEGYGKLQKAIKPGKGTE